MGEKRASSTGYTLHHVLYLPCPSCAAPNGSPCVTPSGKEASRAHMARVNAVAENANISKHRVGGAYGNPPSSAPPSSGEGAVSRYVWLDDPEVLDQILLTQVSATEWIAECGRRQGCWASAPTPAEALRLLGTLREQYARSRSGREVTEP